MRIDKFLKVSRLIKRRTVANEICTNGRILINGKQAKPSSEVKDGDIVTMVFASGLSKIKVLSVKDTVKKNEAADLYEIIAIEKD